MRDRARIVLLAASGMGSRAIGREVGCTPGAVSKRRVRYASDRLAGLSETGNRGAEPRYGSEHGDVSSRCRISLRPPDIRTGRRRFWPDQQARPFVWTKSVVHEKRLKPCFAV